MGSISQATPIGHRRKNPGRRPGKLPTLKIAGRTPRPNLAAGPNCCQRQPTKRQWPLRPCYRMRSGPSGRPCRIHHFRFIGDPSYNNRTMKRLMWAFLSMWLNAKSISCLFSIGLCSTTPAASTNPSRTKSILKLEAVPPATGDGVSVPAFQDGLLSNPCCAAPPIDQIPVLFARR